MKVAVVPSGATCSVCIMLKPVSLAPCQDAFITQVPNATINEQPQECIHSMLRVDLESASCLYRLPGLKGYPLQTSQEDHCREANCEHIRA